MIDKRYKAIQELTSRMIDAAAKAAARRFDFVSTGDAQYVGAYLTEEALADVPLLMRALGADLEVRGDCRLCMSTETVADGHREDYVETHHRYKTPWVEVPDE